MVMWIYPGIQFSKVNPTKLGYLTTECTYTIHGAGVFPATFLLDMYIQSHMTSNAHFINLCL